MSLRSRALDLFDALAELLIERRIVAGASFAGRRGLEAVKREVERLAGLLQVVDVRLPREIGAL